MSGVLRPWRDAPDDIACLVEAFAAPDMFWVDGDITDEASARAWIMHRSEQVRDGRPIFAIEFDALPRGQVMLGSIEPRHATAMVSYWLAPSARGRGLASRAAATLTAWAFEHREIERVELAHRVNNPASGRVAELAGFTFEGIERGRLRYDGIRYDVATYGRLHTDPAPELELFEVHA